MIIAAYKKNSSSHVFIAIKWGPELSLYWQLVKALNRMCVCTGSSKLAGHICDEHKNHMTCTVSNDLF